MCRDGGHPLHKPAIADAPVAAELVAEEIARLELLRRLALGAAHTLNNAFTAILGETLCLADERKGDPVVTEACSLIQSEVERCARLTRQVATRVQRRESVLDETNVGDARAQPRTAAARDRDPQRRDRFRRSRIAACSCAVPVKTWSCWCCSSRTGSRDCPARRRAAHRARGARRVEGRADLRSERERRVAARVRSRRFLGRLVGDAESVLGRPSRRRRRFGSHGLRATRVRQRRRFLAIPDPHGAGSRTRSASDAIDSPSSGCTSSGASAASGSRMNARSARRGCGTTSPASSTI